MKLYFGLGNPGPKYAKTRHNAGFLWLDWFAKHHDFPEFKEQNKCLVSEKSLNGEKIMLIKPLSFMNLSGHAVSHFVQYYKVPLTDILVIFDDVDLPLGTFRHREKGSAGTHNGMKSIIEQLGTNEFPRLRLGIESRGTHAPEQMALDAFVLDEFRAEEMEELEKVFSLAFPPDFT